MPQKSPGEVNPQGARRDAALARPPAMRLSARPMVASPTVQPARERTHQSAVQTSTSARTSMRAAMWSPRLSSGVLLATTQGLSVLRGTAGDTARCGGCNRPCTSLAGGTPLCFPSLCRTICPTGTTACPTAYSRLTTHARKCSACGRVCRAIQVCRNRPCVAL